MTMKTLFQLTLFGALLGVAQAQPAYLNYQGKLTDNTGQPLANGTVTLEFNIWDDANAGNQVWGPFYCDGVVGAGHTAPAIVVNGRFNVILGPTDTAGQPIQDVFTSSTLFLAITVNGTNSILPRQQFLSAPYAFKANHADTASSAATVADANVARLSSNPQTFSGQNTFSSNVTVGGNLTAKGKGVTVGEESNLRIVRGAVSAAGVKVAGSGFNSARPSAATYRVNFDTPFSGTPTIVLSLGAAGQTVASQDVVSLTSATSSFFTVLIGVRNVGYYDEPFSFIAIGPR